MIDRINLLLKAKNIKARQFAEEIGIQPSGMSHILSGRNNPSLDFVMKVVKRWPEVNINWLLFGNGEMYAGLPLNVPSLVPDAVDNDPQPVSSEPYDLFSQPTQQHIPEQEEIPSVSQPIVEETDTVATAPQTQLSDDSFKSVTPQPQISQPTENGVLESGKTSVPAQPILGKKKVTKVIILYDDHSFAEYYPE